MPASSRSFDPKRLDTFRPSIPLPAGGCANTATVCRDVEQDPDHDYHVAPRAEMALGVPPHQASAYIKVVQGAKITPRTGQKAVANIRWNNVVLVSHQMIRAARGPMKAMTVSRQHIPALSSLVSQG